MKYEYIDALDEKLLPDEELMKFLPDAEADMNRKGGVMSEINGDVDLLSLSDEGKDMENPESVAARILRSSEKFTNF